MKLRERFVVTRCKSLNRSMFRVHEVRYFRSPSLSKTHRGPPPNPTMVDCRLPNTRQSGGFP
ncbi:hypothetical protein ACHAXS_004516 [Conticribra weissflogii]